MRPPEGEANLLKMDTQTKSFFNNHVQAIVKKFFQSFEGSNISNTKKAVKLLPTIVNYSNGEIVSKKKAKPLKPQSDENKQREILSYFVSYPILHEVIAINAIAFLCSIKCIVFSSDTELSYDRIAIDRFSKQQIESVFKNDILTYRQNLPEVFKRNPHQCVKEIVEKTQTPIYSLPKSWILAQTPSIDSKTSFDAG